MQRFIPMAFMICAALPVGGALAETPLPLATEPLMQLELELDAPQPVGDTPLGGRRIFPIKGGTFSGPALSGTALPGGADWALVAKDGVGRLDARVTLKTSDGALVYVRYGGISNIPPAVRERIMKGEAVDPAEYYARITPVFETAAEKYAWLNKLVAVGTGRRTRSGVVYSVYAVK